MSLTRFVAATLCSAALGLGAATAQTDAVLTELAIAVGADGRSIVWKFHEQSCGGATDTKLSSPTEFRGAGPWLATMLRGSVESIKVVSKDGTERTVPGFTLSLKSGSLDVEDASGQIVWLRGARGGSRPFSPECVSYSDRIDCHFTQEMHSLSVLANFKEVRILYAARPHCVQAGDARSWWDLFQPHVTYHGGEESSDHWMAVLGRMQSTVDGSLPYMVGKCSGVLVSPDVILTARHCLETRDIRDTYVDVTDYHKPAMSLAVAGCRFVDAADLVLVKLASESKLLEFPRSPPHSFRESQIRRARAIGYGRTSMKHANSKQLSVTLDVVDRSHCVNSFHGRFGTDMICTGGDKDRYACSGDSGGPLILDDASLGPVIVGIAKRSTSPKCKESVKPKYTGFVAVSPHAGLIEEFLKKPDWKPCPEPK